MRSVRPLFRNMSRLSDEHAVIWYTLRRPCPSEIIRPGWPSRADWVADLDNGHLVFTANNDRAYWAGRWMVYRHDGNDPHRSPAAATEPGFRTLRHARLVAAQLAASPQISAIAAAGAGLDAFAASTEETQ